MSDVVRRPLPVTEKLADTLFALPTGKGVELHEINMIGEFLGGIVRHSGDLRRALQSQPTARRAA